MVDDAGAELGTYVASERPGLVMVPNWMGVTDAAVGYMGGTVANPTYEQVCTDRTGHAEVVQVEFDSDEVSYEEGFQPIAVEELLAPRLIGQESLRVEGLWQEMYQESLLQGRSGSVMRGISILDTALWDLNARSAKLPLHLYLGAYVTDSVPAYASGGYYLDGKTPAMLSEDIRLQLSQYIEEPLVSVIVTNFAGTFSQQVRIVGATEKPASIPYRANMTVLDAMIAVGGMSEFAAGNRAKLIRFDKQVGRQREFGLRLGDLLKKGDSQATVMLQPGDVIIIPESMF